MSRRTFLAAAAAAGIGSAMDVHGAPASLGKPALLGGTPVRKEGFPGWPVFDEKDEQALLKVLRTGQWFRGYGKHVDNFEAAYAQLMGAKYCVATANGTSSLIAALAAAGVEAGDEVILPPYTFVACVNAILVLDALPVFVDTDRASFQIDAKKIEAAITEHTKGIMPVHLGGNVVDLDTLLAVARKHSVPVIEDCCQAHMAEWKGKRVGTMGLAGCFSFQASKNLNAGEGGAILTSDEQMVERCYAAHTNGRTRNAGWSAESARAWNFRMTEFQAGLLMAQMMRLEEQSRTREENAKYLTQMLKEIPGIRPAEMYEGCTRNAYHLYMFRYDPSAFAGLDRGKFLRSLSAEGIGAGSGYTPLNTQGFIANTLKSRGFSAIYSKARMAEWAKRNPCPENDRLCGEAVWFTQNMLLGPKKDMEQIAEAVRKIAAYAAELARA